MKALPDLARAPALIAERGSELGRPLHLLDDSPSTNLDAKSAARAGAPHGSTWVAEWQSDGRGRQGRTWVSPRGENLLFSVLVRPPRRTDPTRIPLVSLVAGLAVADAVAHAAPRATVGIKWPNDVVVSTATEPPRKIAGILVEASMTGDTLGAVIVGVGINVHTRAFPDDLAAIATSIALVSDAPPDRAVVLADVLAALDRDVGLVLARGLGPVHARLAARDVLRGERVESEQGSGVAAGIDLEGRLVVERDGARATWNAGEVHLAAKAGRRPGPG